MPHGKVWTAPRGVLGVGRLERRMFPGVDCPVPLTLLSLSLSLSPSLSLSNVFLVLDSLLPQDLAKRLVGRGTETVEQVTMRMSNAKAEINSLNDKGLYDYLIINDNLQEV